jgi:hypothetical protein
MAEENKTNHLMLDFETLGTQPDTAVLSLGAVMFNRDKILAEKLWVFDVQGQLDNDRSVKFETLIWWLQQGEAAKSVFKRSRETGIKIRDFLPQFIAFTEPYKNLRVWGNGASFDVSIIENLLEVGKIKTPWLFYNSRCYRTMKSCFGIDPKDGSFSGTKHDALDDARHQTNKLLEYWKKNPEACN